ncbi:MAG: hypothetical protein U9N45_05070, partial [Gemmatimonadota bacterium]|nr:hypothetical protein [Gemmatimonadota bacterium]
MKNPVPFLIAIVIIAGSVSCAGREEAPKQWWDSALGARVRVTVGPLGVERCDKPVEVPVDFNILLKQAGLNGRLDEKSVRVVETDGQGELIDEQVPFQFDRVTEVGSADDGCGTLVIMAAGISREGGKRVFEVYFDTMENAEERIAAKVEGLVSATDHVMHE